MHNQQRMSTRHGVLVRVLTAAVLGAAGMSAQASDAMSTEESDSGIQAVIAGIDAREPSPFGAVAAVGDDELSGRRGGAAVQNDVKLDGVVGSNEATNTISGANTISSGAFSGSAGLPMVIQNSGNNVLIQNATIVNVQIK